MAEQATALEHILTTATTHAATLHGRADDMIVNVLREVDFIYLYLRGIGQFSPQYTDHFESVHQYGWPALLRAWYPLLTQTEALSIQDSTFALTGEIDRYIFRMGQLIRCRQLLTIHKMGFGSIEQTSKDEFTVTVSVPKAHAEAFDVYDFKYVQQEIISPQLHRLRKRAGFDANRVRKRIYAAVQRPSGTTFSYQPTGYVLDYYLLQGAHHLIEKQLSDDFGVSDLFGSISYGTYRQVLNYLAGTALLHEAYCATADEKFSNTSRRNILTTIQPKSVVIQDIARHLAITAEEASIIVDTLTIGPNNYADYLAITSAPPAPFIQLSTGCLLRSIAGCINNPFYFLNYELKRKYSKDYSKAVNNREMRFRELIYSLFSDERFICISDEINIYLADKTEVATDIDAIVLDTQTNTLGLFQLKWQAPFAHSMAKRRNFISNLQEDADKWIQTVAQWLEENSPTDIYKKLKINKVYKGEPITNSIRLFVIGRYNIHFTGIEQDNRAAWASWPQVVACVHRNGLQIKADLIDALFQAIQRESPHLRTQREGAIVPPDFTLQVGSCLVHSRTVIQDNE